jgi:hypothetical protein
LNDLASPVDGRSASEIVKRRPRNREEDDIRLQPVVERNSSDARAEPLHDRSDCLWQTTTGDTDLELRARE